MGNKIMKFCVFLSVVVLSFGYAIIVLPLVKYFIEDVLSDSFNVHIPDSISPKGRVSKGRLNNDKAESFIFLLRMITKLDINGLASRVKSEVIGLSHEGEKLLRSR